jgi:hypothetical protein
MKVTTCNTIVALFFICLVACSKNDSISPTSFAGKWKVTGYQGTIVSDFAFIRNDTTVEQTEYQTSVSTAIGGYESFTGNSTSSDSIFVNAQFTQKLTISQNGVILSDTTTKFPASQNTFDVSSDFEIIGSDSIHFDGPGIPLTNGLVAIGGAQGAVFSISGKTMTITTHTYASEASSPFIFDHDYQSFVITLVRQ